MTRSRRLELSQCRAEPLVIDKRHGIVFSVKPAQRESNDEAMRVVHDSAHGEAAASVLRSNA